MNRTKPNQRAESHLTPVTIPAGQKSRQPIVRLTLDRWQFMNGAFKLIIIVPLFLGAIFAGGGCFLESGYAVVEDGVLSARNPPIQNDRSFEVTAVDDAAFQRVMIIPFRDMSPGVLVTPGTHRFKMRVKPMPPPFSSAMGEPYDITFSATVLAGHRYMIASSNGNPAFVEAR
jgi:hypothetical protein